MPKSDKSHVGETFLDRYKILEELGAGGMGTVYLGEHTGIGRQVAIKVLPRTLADDEEFTQRFEREARVAGQLDHPNCVPVTDFGHLEDGTNFLVMELVKGKTLTELLEEEGALPPERALRITRHVLRGLGHAHALGIVHRDIKPDNVMLVQHKDDCDFARVLDFGLATLRESEPAERLTSVGIAMGTPHYLSPEQAVAEEVDSRSDLYSTSAMLYEMLTGEPPFDGASAVDIMKKHATVNPKPLSESQPLLANMPLLEKIVAKGLAKPAIARHESADSYVAEIDACLVDMGAVLTPITGPIPATTAPLQAQSVATPVPPGSFVMTSRMMLAAGAGLVLLLGLLVFLFTRDETPPPPPPGNELEANLSLLQKGKTCEQRLEAVVALEKLGKPVAIPALKSARRRMRKKPKGKGMRNTNACLRKAANQAIKTLQELEKQDRATAADKPAN